MCVKALSTCQWQIKGRGPGPPLFLDQTDAQRVEKNGFCDQTPLSQGLDDRHPPPALPEGLDPPLNVMPSVQNWPKTVHTLVTKPLTTGGMGFLLMHCLANGLF